MRVDIFSHSFMVSELSERQKQVVTSFARGLVSYKKVSDHGVTRNVMDKVWASAFDDRRFYRFHINLLNDFRKHVGYHQIASTEIQKTVHEITLDETFQVVHDVKEIRPLGGVGYEKQIELVEHIVSPGGNKILNLQAGAGKAQPLYAKIKIPGGWTTMGKIKVGDEVISKDGTVTKVTGVFPQGKKQLYQVTFGDGRKTECCAEHLWKVYYPNTVKHARWRVINTMEMIEILSKVRSELYVELIDPEEGIDVDLPLDPYVMGVLLGDAHLGYRTVSLSTPDQFILDQVREKLPDELELKHKDGIDFTIQKKVRSNKPNAYVEIMRGLGLAGKLSHEKKVPAVYLNASRAQRLAILQGLLDTDGTADKHGSVSFNSTSVDLAHDVQYLARSLGAIAKIAPRQTHFTNSEGEKVPGRPSWNVYIRHRRPSELFRLPKKKDRVNDDNQYAATLKLRVKSIVPTTVERAQCISVDHPEHLYVTDDFIVTHNTLMAMHAMITLGLRTAIFMRGGLLSRWTPDLEKTFKLKRGELLVIRGGDSLNAIMEMALENDIDQVKIFMISLDSYSDYIRDFEEKGVSAEYPIEPGKFFERLKVGFGILDEAHMNAHQVMKLFTYMHVHKFLSLSATLDTREAFKDRMYAVMFPREQRAGKDFYKVYIRAKCVKYQLHRPKAIRYTGFGGAYSHNAFEASLMTQKNKVALKNYIDLIAWIIDTHYVKVMKKGMKAIVFCGTVKMCTMLTKYFAKKYKHLDVRRYVSEDPAKNLQEAELIFSTVLSAGTGHDIPNLLVGIMTTAIDSQQSNEQTKGRTRPLKDFPGVDPWFVYLACSDIDKHMRYHFNKQKAFENLVLSHATEQAPITV